MKKYLSLLLTLAMSLSMLSGCGGNQNTDQSGDAAAPVPETVQIEGTQIELSDAGVSVDGVAAANDETQAVYVANDIVYYEAGHDFTYGEGDQDDEHSKEEADQHTVVHITQPGNYVLSGTMSAAQIAVDLGKDSKEDPEAVVNLYLNGVDITNTVAPAVIFYNAYEPFHDVDETTAVKDVDTSGAGANVFIVDGTENHVTGSHVARIYKPDSVVLNEAGTEVIEEKKLHKYDAAFYSKVTMNMNGGEENTGILNIKADNEGLDSELHLTINGGTINIESGNDGINTNEDGISVTTMNGGTLNILVNGSTGEGDGIDSNGWLVINGGTLTSQACGFSMDGGIDSDMGIHINGGTVIASGNMLDRISESNQTYAVLNFSKFLGAGTYRLKNAEGAVVLEKNIENSLTSLIVSSADLKEGDYTLWYNDTQLVGSVSENGNMFGGGMPGGMTPTAFNGERPEMPGNFDPNQMPDMGGMTPPAFNGEGSEMPGNFNPGQMPDMGGMTPPAGFNGGKMDFEQNEDGTVTLPDGSVVNPAEFEGKGQGGRGPGGAFGGNMPNEAIELSEIFTIKSGANYFSFITMKENMA